MNSDLTNNPDSISPRVSDPALNSPVKEVFVFPIKKTVLILLLFLLAIGAGYLIWSATAKKPLFPGSGRKPANAVFTSAVSMVATVGGEIVENQSNYITLKKGGSQLKIAINNDTQFILKNTSALKPRIIKRYEIQKGMVVEGSVILSSEFAAGDKEGEVKGTYFEVKP